LGGLAIVTD